MSTPTELLKTYWGFDEFKPLQEDIIRELLNRRDVLALLPTGGGKSICYQIPALCQPGFCLVISPLIALMKDQVQGLKKRGIAAAFIHTGMTYPEMTVILQHALNGRLKLLFVSPERIETTLFQEYLPGFDINLLAVDEAHCISAWGHDFRPAYRRISALREMLPGIPVLALTATATPAVQSDIKQQLRMDSPSVFQGSLLRPNLSFSVLAGEIKLERLLTLLNRVRGSSIIYCNSRKGTENIARLLNENGVSADYYHGRLTPGVRHKKQESWMEGGTMAMVCTNAFGMGIDKAEVRLVVHYDVPDSLENYLQEAGRAGRDGKGAYAVLFQDDAAARYLAQIPDLRYPGEQEIREVYRDLVHFLQIPAESGEMEWFDFPLDTFLTRFNRNTTTTLYALKALEQEEILLYTEQAYQPARATFIVNKEELYRFQKNNAALTPLIDALLRNYPGIFDHLTTIYERQLANIIRMDETQVGLLLQQMDRSALIEYQPQTQSPQIRLLQPRVRMENLRIDYHNYLLRKEECVKRVTQMITYLKQTTECRSQFINRYFGDTLSPRCGICDVCRIAGQTGATGARPEGPS